LNELTIKAERESPTKQEINPHMETEQAPPERTSQPIRKLIDYCNREELQLLYEPADFRVYNFDNAEVLFLKLHLRHDTANDAFESMIANFAISSDAHWLVSHFVWRLPCWNETIPELRERLETVRHPDTLAETLYERLVKEGFGYVIYENAGADLSQSDERYDPEHMGALRSFHNVEEACLKIEQHKWSSDHLQGEKLEFVKKISSDSELERELVRRAFVGHDSKNMAEDIASGRSKDDEYWYKLIHRYKELVHKDQGSFGIHDLEERIENQLLYRLHNWGLDSNIEEPWEKHPKKIEARMLAKTLHERDGLRPRERTTKYWNRIQIFKLKDPTSECVHRKIVPRN
jgi:hypothetical protein